jgi:AraC-like DNA-binding protein
MNRRSKTGSERAGTLPAVHVLELAELVGRWGVAADEVLAGTGLTREALADPQLVVSVPTVERVIERARALTGEPGLGFYLGLGMRLSSHGYVGLAAMTASTLRDALDLTVRFSPTRTSALAFRLHEGRSLASLVIEERVPLGRAQDVIVWSLMVGLWQLGVALTGVPLVGDVDLAFAEPDYFERFRHLGPGGRARFGARRHGLTFASSFLDLPIRMADPAAFRMLRAQCERALEALGFADRVSARVRRLLLREEGGLASLEEVAARLAMSSRTLRRRLADEGTVYRTIVDEERRERALLFVRNPDLALDDVAARLGYSDLANFTRAFRRWTGTTPGAYRQRHRSGR